MKDQFDDFLKTGINKISREIPDDGFSKTMAKNVIKQKPFYKRRGVIIFSFTILSIVIFFKAKALENIFSLINLNFSQDGFLKGENINYNHLIFLAMFCLILIIIPIIETDEDAL